MHSGRRPESRWEIPDSGERRYVARKPVPLEAPAMVRHLTPERQAEADRIEKHLLELARDDFRELAERLVSRSDGRLLGATEYQVRDHAHRIGARALDVALAGREKRTI